MKSIFITGVDTDIGKTFVSVGLCLALESKKYSVGYYKPFQSGAYENNETLIAPDVDVLKKYSNIPSRYSYLFKGDVSPHLASIISNVDVDINKVVNDYKLFCNSKDFVIVEGAGGLYCPMVKGMLCYEIIKELDCETIIVTTPKLGRINHTLMTIQCALSHGLKIKGLIINMTSSSPSLSEKNFVKELTMFTNVEILAQIPFMDNPDKKDLIKAFEKINL